MAYSKLVEYAAGAAAGKLGGYLTDKVLANPKVKEAALDFAKVGGGITYISAKYVEYLDALKEENVKAAWENAKVDAEKKYVSYDYFNATFGNLEKAFGNLSEKVEAAMVEWNDLKDKLG